MKNPEEPNLLVMEFSPLDLLTYKQVLNVRYKGREKLARGKMLILEGQPVLQKDLPGLKEANYQGRYWLTRAGRALSRYGYTVVFRTD